MNDARLESTSSELRQVVHSPEQYRLELPIAGPSSRILAYAIDYILIGILMFLTIIAALVILPLADQLQVLNAEIQEAASSADPNNVLLTDAFLIMIGFVIVIQLVVETGYFVFFELTMRGRSPGKAIVKLRVVSDGGHPLSFGQSVARNLMRAVDILPTSYVVGLIAMVISPEAKRLGDLAAGTVVIRLDRPARAAPIDAALDARTEIFRFDHGQIARIGSKELRLIRQTLRRLPDLDEARAARVLERTVTVLCELLEHEAVDPADREVFLRALLQTVARR